MSSFLFLVAKAGYLLSGQTLKLDKIQRSTSMTPESIAFDALMTSRFAS